MSQYAVVTDLNRCTGCLACTVACKAANGVPVGNFWIRSMRVGPVTKEEGGQFPDVKDLVAGVRGNKVYELGDVDEATLNGFLAKLEEEQPAS